MLSEYMEMLAAQDPTAARLPGARGVALVIIALSVLLLPLWIPFARALRLSATTQFVASITILLFVLTMTVLLTTGVIGPRRRLWWAALRKCGHDVCIQCGYLLEHRAADSHTCPECGLPDSEQLVPLGERTANREWTRYPVEPPQDSKEPDSTDRA